MMNTVAHSYKYEHQPEPSTATYTVLKTLDPFGVDEAEWAYW